MATGDFRGPECLSIQLSKDLIKPNIPLINDLDFNITRSGKCIGTHKTCRTSSNNKDINKALGHLIKYDGGAKETSWSYMVRL